MSTRADSKFVVRKRQERGERRVAAIVAAAAALFAERGFDGTSMNAIAQASGVTIGSLYQYFPNRDAIVDAVAEQYLREMRAHRASVLSRASGISLRPLVELAIRENLAFQASHAGIKTFLDADPNRAYCIRAIHEEVEAAAPVLAALYPDKPFEELARVTYVVAALFRGLSSAFAGVDGPEEREMLLHELSEVLCAYTIRRLGDPIEPERLQQEEGLPKEKLRKT